jgi:hypothetical protein
LQTRKTLKKSQRFSLLLPHEIRTKSKGYKKLGKGRCDYYRSR